MRGPALAACVSSSRMALVASKFRTTVSAGTNGEGNGLRGMRERVEMLGGTLHRGTEAGTTLTITLPLKETGAERRSRAKVARIESLLQRRSQDHPRGSGGRSGHGAGRSGGTARDRRRHFRDRPGAQRKEALEAVLAHKPDVFITDIEMPHMSGLDVAAELKRRRTGTRVVIVTTFARAGYLRARSKPEPRDTC